MDAALTGSSAGGGEPPNLRGAPDGHHHHWGLLRRQRRPRCRLQDQHRIRLGQPATVKVAANFVRLLDYQNKNMLQAGMIVGGWDRYEGGKIFSAPLGGTILRQPNAIGGSGSSYLYALLDNEWREGMSHEETEKFVVKIVSLTMACDGASGGVVRVTINADGVKRRFYPGDKGPLWHEELEPRSSLLDLLAVGNPDPMVQ